MSILIVVLLLLSNVEKALSSECHKKEVVDANGAYS